MKNYTFPDKKVVGIDYITSGTKGYEQEYYRCKGNFEQQMKGIDSKENSSSVDYIIQKLSSYSLLELEKIISYIMVEQLNVGDGNYKLAGLHGDIEKEAGEVLYSNEKLAYSISRLTYSEGVLLYKKVQFLKQNIDNVNHTMIDRVVEAVKKILK